MFKFMRNLFCKEIKHLYIDESISSEKVSIKPRCNHCSYCKSSEHNITKCVDAIHKIKEIYDICHLSSDVKLLSILNNYEFIILKRYVIKYGILHKLSQIDTSSYNKNDKHDIIQIIIIFYTKPELSVKTKPINSSFKHSSYFNSSSKSNKQSNNKNDMYNTSDLIKQSANNLFIANMLLNY